MPDTYRNFAQLANRETEGKDFRIRFNSRDSDILVMAPHGGEIEPGTSEIATAVAGDELSLYVFDGLKPEANGELHITSTRFDEPRCLALLPTCSAALTLHGEGSSDAIIYIGGLDQALGAKIEDSLLENGFVVGAHANKMLQGTSKANICNCGNSEMGVQLEIGRGLREQLFSSLDKAGRSEPTPLFDKLVSALREALI